MPRDTRDTTPRGQNGPAVRTQAGRTPQGGVEVATDLDLAGILTRLTMDLEHFEATLAIERGRIENPMPFEQPGRNSERISSTVAALVSELLQILTLLRRLERPTDIRPAAGGGPTAIPPGEGF